MLSRALGLVREILIAALLGAGPIADAFFVAFRLPNLFRRFFAEGAFNMAFVPLFAKRLEAEGPQAARRFGEEVLACLLCFVFTLTLFAQLAMPWLIYGIAAGFADDPEKLALATTFSIIQFPYLMFMSLVALFAGVLNSLHKFAAAAAAPILLNLSMIAGIGLAWALERDFGLWLSYAVFIAGVLQFWLVAGAAKKAGMALRLRWPRWTNDIKQLLALGAPGIFAGGVTQINILIGTTIATFFDGAVAWLTYADRLYQLPLGVVGVALSVALLPDLSRRMRADDMDGAKKTLRQATVISMAFAMPAAAVLICIPDIFVAVLFGRGAFGADDVTATATAVALFAIGLPAYVLIKSLSPAYFAAEDTRTPVIYAAVSTAFATGLSIGLALFIAWIAIPIGTAAGAWLNVILLERGLRRRDAAAFDSWVIGRVVRFVLATLAMVAGLLWVTRSWPDIFLVGGGRYLAVLGLVVGGAAVFGAVALLCGGIRKSDLGSVKNPRF
jgi:putative peptidoglycan lipid II flippase